MARTLTMLFFCLLLSTTPGHGQTFFVVVEETRDGEQLQRPSPSQEGILSGLYDLGYVSFDSGHYRPAVDWERQDFREPLAIAASGLARYVIGAEVKSQTQARTVAAGNAKSEEGKSAPALAIATSVRYYLLDADSGVLIGRGAFQRDNSGEKDREHTYRQFLHLIGEAIAREAQSLLKNQSPSR